MKWVQAAMLDVMKHKTCAAAAYCICDLLLEGAMTKGGFPSLQCSADSIHAMFNQLRGTMLC